MPSPVADPFEGVGEPENPLLPLPINMFKLFIAAMPAIEAEDESRPQHSPIGVLVLKMIDFWIKILNFFRFL